MTAAESSSQLRDQVNKAANGFALGRVRVRTRSLVHAIHGTTIAGAPMNARRFRLPVHAIHATTIAGAPRVGARKFRFATVRKNLYGLGFCDFFGTSLRVQSRCLEVHNNIVFLL